MDVGMKLDRFDLLNSVICLELHYNKYEGLGDTSKYSSSYPTELLEVKSMTDSEGKYG